MEGPIIAAVLSSTLPKLYLAIQGGGKKLLGLEADVRSIESELRYIKAAINDYHRNRYHMSNLRRIWIADLRRLAYDIEDCVDRFLLPHGAKTMNHVWLAAEIDQLKTSAKEIHERLQRYINESSKQKPQDGASSSTSGAPTSHERDIPGHAEHEVVGMEEPLLDLLALLQESESRSEKKLKVISIVGFGGMGKTLLAGQVYNRMHPKYPMHAFISARGKDKEEILKAVLEKLPKKDVKGKSVIEVSTSIQSSEVDMPQGIQDPSASTEDNPQIDGGVHNASLPRKNSQMSHGGVDGSSASIKDQRDNGINDASTSTQDTHVSGCTKEPQAKIGAHGSGVTTNNSKVNNDVPNPSAPVPLQSNNGVHGLSASIPTEGDNVVHCLSPSQHRNDFQTQLRSRLGSNRYFIVIDDIQMEQLGCDIISAFPQEKEVDSRIIITTTVQSIGKACSGGDGHVYKMRPLEDGESEILFFKVSCKGWSPSDAMEQESLDIRKRCDGVPLALVSIAKFCNGDLSRCEEAWSKLCTSKEDNRLASMQRVLVDNYNSLCNLGIQDCLLYFCMFPHGHTIRRGSLIRRWMAEGPAIGCCSSSAALGNFKTLIDRNVIWPIQGNNNENVKTCQPPGVMLEYITGISKSENFMMLSCGDGTCQPQDIRRLSLHHTSAADDGRVLQQEDVSRLRTLAVFSKGQEGHLDFAKCKLLRVLDLEACNCVNKSHLVKVCELLHLLRYLSLRACITKVPSKITMLQWLETLDLGKETVVKVPVEVIELPRLRNLLGKFKLLKDYSSDKGLIKFLSEKSKLETLAGFLTRKGKGFPQLMRHMSRLVKVKIWCDSRANAEKLSTMLSDAIKEFLRKTLAMPAAPNSLSIDFQESSETFPDFLHAPHRGSLLSLKLRGHGRLSQVPQFVTNVCGIKDLCLSSTTLIITDDVLAGLSNLHSLQYLKLVARSIEGPVVIRPDHIKSLVRMCLVAEQMLPLITIQDKTMQYLVSLHLIWRGLDGLSGVKITHLKGLKEVALHSAAAEETKEKWKEAAKGHPNRPPVLFIE